MGDLIDAAVNRRLLLSTELTATFGTRIFPNGAPKGTGRPYLVWQLGDSQQLRTLGGVLNNGTADVTFQAVADDYRTAREAAEVVKRLFDGWRDQAEDPRIAGSTAAGPSMVLDVEASPWAHVSLISARIRFVLNP